MKPAQTPLDSIAAATEWYMSTGKSFNDIDGLMEASKRYSIHIFNYASEVGNLYKAKNLSEWKRKANYAVKKQELVLGGSPVSRAESEADESVKDLRYEEQMADGDYVAGRLQLEAAKDVLDRMNQHISHLKQEKRMEMSNQGSQG